MSDLDDAYVMLENACTKYVDALCALEHAHVNLGSSNPFDLKNAYLHYKEDHGWEDHEVVGMLLYEDSDFVSEMHDAEHEAMEAGGTDEEGIKEHKHGNRP